MSELLHRRQTQKNYKAKFSHNKILRDEIKMKVSIKKYFKKISNNKIKIKFNIKFK